MNKTSLTGYIMMGVILFGFAWYNSTQHTEYNRQKAIADSIAAASQPRTIETPITPSLNANPATGAEAMSVSDTVAIAQQAQSMEQHMGEALYGASQGAEEFYAVENDLMKITFSNKGARVAAVELKNYKTYADNPLVLFNSKTSEFDLSFFIKQNFNNMQVNTSGYYFTPVNPADFAFKEGETTKTVAMRLNVDSTSYVEYLYTIQKDNYMIDFDIRFVGMETLMSSNQSDLSITWKNIGPQNEKGFENENNYTTIAYNYPGAESIEELGISKESKEETLNTKLKWVAFKQQFFSSIFVAQDDFQNGTVQYHTFAPASKDIKAYYAKMSVPYSTQTTDYKFNFYFGPNKFSTLKQYDLHFERLVPLGWGIIGWVNRWLVIPTFDILGKHIANYGLIILLLTIFIKILIAPLTYKSYLSTAKMRLLKPDIDKIGEKYPKSEDALKKQQATMALYKSAGVNPMGGCLPMLIQFPILIAMFRFFPSSIELRGEHFLWADDLSSYDSILNLPFDIPLYGSHVSLFALLMAVSVYISSKINYTQTASSAPQMAGMKFMMLYMMPVMLLVWFNNYSSGLSYYYLVSNIITIGQTYIFMYTVNDQKLHQRLKDNAKKPHKKSKWQQRMDDMMKQREQMAKQQRR